MSTETKSSAKPIIYIPGLADLGTDNFDLYKAIHANRIDLAEKLIDAGMGTHSIDRTESSLKNMVHNAKLSDAFLFPPLTSLPEDHPRFEAEAAQRWFELFSITTGMHVGTDEKYKNGISKPCVVMDPNGQWASTIDLLRDLGAKGMFSTRVEDIIQLVPNAEHLSSEELNQTAVDMLSKAIAEKKGMAQKAVHSKYPADHFFEPFRNDEVNDKTRLRHPFGIAFFGSATTNVDSYKQASFDLAKMTGQRGWRMTSGAGTDGCMGAADRGFMEGKTEFNQRHPRTTYKPAHIGVSTQSILRLEGPPEHLDQLIITDDIYERMKIMIKGKLSSDPKSRTRDATKVLFVAPGGTGTLHEFATLMQLVNNGSMMEGRKIVLLDIPSHLNPTEGFWDPLIKIAEKFGFRDNFEVAHSPEEAMKIADDFYLEWLGAHPEFRNLPHLVHNKRNTSTTEVG